METFGQLALVLAGGAVALATAWLLQLRNEAEARKAVVQLIHLEVGALYITLQQALDRFDNEADPVVAQGAPKVEKLASTIATSSVIRRIDRFLDAYRQDRTRLVHVRDGYLRGHLYELYDALEELLQALRAQQDRPPGRNALVDVGTVREIAKRLASFGPRLERLAG